MRTQHREEAHVEARMVDDPPVCDLCGLKAKGRHSWLGGYDESETAINAQVGDFYPEADCREGYRLDLCPDCFTDKFVPAVESALGVKFTRYDVDGFSGYYT